MRFHLIQSTASEDGRNYRPKHVELIGIINKPLLLHLVGCLYYCISDARSYKYQIYDVLLGRGLHNTKKGTKIGSNFLNGSEMWAFL